MIVLVTGATAGFGLAITRRFAADAVHWVATRPARVNLDLLQVMPVAQSYGPLRVHRDS